MNNKILILVNCPVLEKTYEIFVPVGKKIGTEIGKGISNFLFGGNSKPK